MGWLSLDRVTKTHGWSSIGDSFVTSCLRTSEGEEGKGLMLCMCLVSGAPEQARIIRSSNIIVEWAYMSNYADKFITSCLRRRREQRSSCEQATNYDCMAAPRFLEPSLPHCAANIRRLIGAISTQLVFCYASCIIQKMHIAGAHIIPGSKPNVETFLRIQDICRTWCSLLDSSSRFSKTWIDKCLNAMFLFQ